MDYKALIIFFICMSNLYTIIIVIWEKDTMIFA
jgi:hypothetical protein